VFFHRFLFSRLGFPFRKDISWALDALRSKRHTAPSKTRDQAATTAFFPVVLWGVGAFPSYVFFLFTQRLLSFSLLK